MGHKRHWTIWRKEPGNYWRKFVKVFRLADLSSLMPLLEFRFPDDKWESTEMNEWPKK